MKQYIILLLWKKTNTFLPEMRDEERSGYLFSAECKKLVVVMSEYSIIGYVRRKVWKS